MISLYPYQLEVFRAVLDSVEHHRGYTFTVEIARQGGKNEISAQIEAARLSAFAAAGGSAVKASPTFNPQAQISIQRLKDRLDDYGFKGVWVAESSHILRLGAARQVFLSAAKTASVVGHTAGFLEIDESQDVSKLKYSRDFRPMRASSNATTVLYGTPWTDATLLEEVKQHNLELERKDGRKRHFSFDWQVVAACNPLYRAAALQELERLGPTHPWWLTQYALKTLPGLGRFFSRAQMAQLEGRHPRLRRPADGRVFVAGLDLAGEEEGGGIAFSSSSFRGRPEARPEESGEVPYPVSRNPRDSTVFVIAEVVNGETRVVEHYSWTGVKHPALYQQLVNLITKWGCRRVVVDATGVGAGVASFLQQALGGLIVPFKFTAKSKSDLGYELLAAVNSDRLKLHVPDGSADYAELVRQLELCRPSYQANKLLNFYVDPDDGHDDYVVALALTVEAARSVPKPRHAFGSYAA